VGVRGKNADGPLDRVSSCLASQFGLTLPEEIPPVVDQIRFFAAAARMLGGRFEDYTRVKHVMISLG
jgi:hypothetical protein